MCQYFHVIMLIYGFLQINTNIIYFIGDRFNK